MNRINSITNSSKLPIGYHKFHKNKLFNFQLNRWYSFGYARFEDFVEAGKAIHSFDDWKREMINLAELAYSENMILRAAFYYRAAEFYLLEDIPEKSQLYQKFNQLFYQAIHNDNTEKINVPYRESFLPALKISPTGRKKSTIVMHGGFDSFIEEFYSMMSYFTDHGYEVIAFEGPGQGAARRQYDLAFDIEWEKPVKSVLDYFDLNAITLLGISMGGWLCLRSAAFESRIARVIATGHAIDYMKTMNAFFYWLHMRIYKKHKDFMARLTEKKFLRNKETIPGWMIKHLMYITKKDKPLDALETYIMMNERNIHSELITQDVLLLLGKGDHLIPFKMLEMQANALINAKSVTTRVFTKKEHAQNHCQIGNIALSLDVMVTWLDQISQ
jgi:pimeloyl-ACP methyl ester carboxylesterase